MTVAIAAAQHEDGQVPPALLRLVSPFRSQHDELSMLGKGGFGAVTLVRSRLDHRLLAVKAVRFRSTLPPWVPPQALEAEHEKILREVRALSALSWSPHVVQYLNAWVEPDWPRLGMMLGRQARQHPKLATLMHQVQSASCDMSIPPLLQLLPGTASGGWSSSSTAPGGHPPSSQTITSTTTTTATSERVGSSFPARTPSSAVIHAISREYEEDENRVRLSAPISSHGKRKPRGKIKPHGVSYAPSFPGHKKGLTVELPAPWSPDGSVFPSSWSPEGRSPSCTIHEVQDAGPLPPPRALSLPSLPSPSQSGSHSLMNSKLHDGRHVCTIPIPETETSRSEIMSESEGESESHVSSSGTSRNNAGVANRSRNGSSSDSSDSECWGETSSDTDTSETGSETGSETDSNSSDDGSDDGTRIADNTADFFALPEVTPGGHDNHLISISRGVGGLSASTDSAFTFGGASADSGHSPAAGRDMCVPTALTPSSGQETTDSVADTDAGTTWTETDLPSTASTIGPLIVIPQQRALARTIPVSPFEAHQDQYQILPQPPGHEGHNMKQQSHKQPAHGRPWDKQKTEQGSPASRWAGLSGGHQAASGKGGLDPGLAGADGVGDCGVLSGVGIRQWPYKLFISMEPVAGVTLDRWLLERAAERKRHRATAAKAGNGVGLSTDTMTTDTSSSSLCLGLVEKDIFLQLVQGLMHVHQAGIMHRDVKPSNIFVSPRHLPNIHLQHRTHAMAKASYSHMGGNRQNSLPPNFAPGVTSSALSFTQPPAANPFSSFVQPIPRLEAAKHGWSGNSYASSSQFNAAAPASSREINGGVTESSLLVKLGDFGLSVLLGGDGLTMEDPKDEERGSDGDTGGRVGLRKPAVSIHTLSSSSGSLGSGGSVVVGVGVESSTVQPSSAASAATNHNDGEGHHGPQRKQTGGGAANTDAEYRNCSTATSATTTTTTTTNFNTTRTHTSGVGTASYAAPEQRSGPGAYTQAVDVYPLGLILLELTIPFETGMERVIALQEARQGRLPLSITTNLPDEASLIRTLLSPHPIHRPTCGQLLDVLRTLWCANAPDDAGQATAADPRRTSPCSTRTDNTGVSGAFQTRPQQPLHSHVHISEADTSDGSLNASGAQPGHGHEQHSEQDIAIRALRLHPSASLAISDSSAAGTSTTIHHQGGPDSQTFSSQLAMSSSRRLSCHLSEQPSIISCQQASSVSVCGPSRCSGCCSMCDVATQTDMAVVSASVPGAPEMQLPPPAHVLNVLDVSTPNRLYEYRGQMMAGDQLLTLLLQRDQELSQALQGRIEH